MLQILGCQNRPAKCSWESSNKWENGKVWIMTAIISKFWARYMHSANQNTESSITDQWGDWLMIMIVILSDGNWSVGCTIVFAESGLLFDFHIQLILPFTCHRNTKPHFADLSQLLLSLTSVMCGGSVLWYNRDNYRKMENCEWTDPRAGGGWHSRVIPWIINSMHQLSTLHGHYIPMISTATATTKTFNIQCSTHASFTLTENKCLTK